MAMQRFPQGIPMDYVPALIFITGVVFIIGLPVIMYSLYVLYSANVWIFYATLLLMSALMKSTGTAIKRYKKTGR